MYSQKKQQELASIATAIFRLNSKTFSIKDNEEIADNLLLDIEYNKKQKLKNYIKIIANSSIEKSSILFESYELNCPEIKGLNYKQVIETESLLLGLLIVYELSIVKSKELKHDLRLKLVEELISNIEISNKNLIKHCHRTLTKIIER